MSDAITFEEVEGFGLSAGQSTLLIWAVLWLALFCFTLHRRNHPQSSGMLSLLEHLERLQDEGVDMSLDEDDDVEKKLLELTREVSSAEWSMLRAQGKAEETVTPPHRDHMHLPNTPRNLDD